MKKFALVLSGGGFKGAFQVGALQYLKQNWEAIAPGHLNMKFDIVAGVSVGCLNGYMVASNQFEALEKLWKDVGQNGVEEIYTSDFIDTQSSSDKLTTKLNAEQLVRRFLPKFSLELSLWKGLGLLFSASKRDKFTADMMAKAVRELTENLKHFKALADNTPLKRKLADFVRVDAIEDCVFKSGFVSLADGHYYSIRHDEFGSDQDFQNGILASTAMPIIWEPVPHINTKHHQAAHLVDGGIRNVSPLGDVIEEINRDTSGAEYTIVIINCGNGSVRNGDFANANIAQIALRSLVDISLSEIFSNDIREFMRINDLVEQVNTLLPAQLLFNYDFLLHQRTQRPLKSFNAIIIQPDDEELGDTLVANEALVEKRIKHGMKKAELALTELLQPA